MYFLQVQLIISLEVGARVWRLQKLPQRRLFPDISRVFLLGKLKSKNMQENVLKREKIFKIFRVSGLFRIVGKLFLGKIEEKCSTGNASFTWKVIVFLISLWPVLQIFSSAIFYLFRRFFQVFFETFYLFVFVFALRFFNALLWFSDTFRFFLDGPDILYYCIPCKTGFNLWTVSFFFNLKNVPWRRSRVRSAPRCGLDWPRRVWGILRCLRRFAYYKTEECSWLGKRRR